MKKFISKVKKATKDFFTNKSAFSLVELIVVIAIMAVMAAVLAPALLGYVERSRAQKDDSAMDEVVASVQLALADQNVYDEVLEHSVYDNVSCYIDTASEADHAGHKVTLKDAHGEYKEQYMFDDEARLSDETVYYAAGNMRGMTVTFSPSDSGDTYDLKNGVINKFVGRKTGYLYENPELYNRVRSTIGDTLETTSQTYRNSDYTLFIRVGSTGGAEAQAQDAISVWGQYNGTNLAEKDHSYVLATGRVVGAAGANDATTNEQQQSKDDNVIFGENYIDPLNPSGIIPDGCYYYVGVTDFTPGNYTATTILRAGDKFPEVINDGDIYITNDYDYCYNYFWGGNLSGISDWRADSDNMHGWGVKARTNKTEYSQICETINGQPITSIKFAFSKCTKLITTPIIPDSVTCMAYAFYECTALTTVTNLPSKTDDIYYTFYGCTSLTSVPNIPNGVENMTCGFYRCTSLVTAPEIPSSVTSLYSTFCDCTSLTGTIVVHANPTPSKISYTLRNTKIDKVEGNCSSSTKTKLLNTR